MRATNASDFRKNLAKELDRVNHDHEPLVIVRTGGKPGAVLIPLEDFGSQDETDYLLSTEANREALMKALEEYKAGRFVAHELIDVEE